MLSKRWLSDRQLLAMNIQLDALGMLLVDEDMSVTVLIPPKLFLHQSVKALLAHSDTGFRKTGCRTKSTPLLGFSPAIIKQDPLLSG